MTTAKGISTRRSASAQELKREFALVDVDGDGRVSFQEFKRLLEDLDAGMSESDVRIGFREVDSDHDGLIDCQEFIEWWSAD